MKWKRIINLGRYAVTPEISLQPVALFHTYDELVVHVSAVRRLGWHGHIGLQISIADQLTISTCIQLSRSRPLFEMPQLDSQDRRLQCIQAAVDAHHLIVILAPATMS